jgi:hypothetical protein
MVVCTCVSVNCSIILIVSRLGDSNRSVVLATMQHMPSVESDFTPLERAVLLAICEMHPGDRGALEGQLSTAIVLKRENTGAGFYTRFSIERTSDIAIEGERMKGGPAVSIDGLEHDGIYSLAKEGYADCLESYCYEESMTGIALHRAGVKIL